MASESIMDTLEFFPHNYQIPQLSSTNRLLMAAKDMADDYQILTRKSHSQASGMTPYQPLVTWRQFSNSNYDKLCLPRLNM
jgi:hypothetical protein